ncbi:mannan endo-1,6-alpha-mannosidase [Tothia fuscella]|uniref:Mannan endo-1,6-alpha-mannosidase n=1 Tax=Tothia fuscella TaxID=1048955 RepID=A0A9P4TZD7_9PEZI|nr:mannan endo-1,6-alpha-mannosidase [Tothia fuscella]
MLVTPSRAAIFRDRHLFPLLSSIIDSVKSAARTVAKGLLSSYNGDKPGETPGLFGSPYYWWSDGAIWDAMVDYWYLTGDSTYNDVVEQSLAWQVGPNDDYMPPNQTKVLGNDDQSTWAHAALTAAERSFPSKNNISYLSLAENVFNTQVARWDDKTCGGAARLAHFTGNKTYSDWAEKMYQWTEKVGLIGEGGEVYDGTDATKNCSEVNHIQWSSHLGNFIHGSALMYNITNGNSTWQNRTQTHLTHLKSTFFPAAILTETACESNGKCDIDQFFFKGLLSRDLARTAQIAPFTSSKIRPLLAESAKAAASIGCAQNDQACVINWSKEGSWTSNLGSQFSVLQVIQANLVEGSKAPSGSGTTSNNTTPASGSGIGSGASPSATQGSNAGKVVQNGAFMSFVISLVFRLLM